MCGLQDHAFFYNKRTSSDAGSWALLGVFGPLALMSLFVWNAGYERREAREETPNVAKPVERHAVDKGPQTGDASEDVMDSDEMEHAQIEEDELQESPDKNATPRTDLWWNLIVAGPSGDMWITRFFCMFFLGASAWWTLDGRIPKLVFWLYVAAFASRIALQMYLVYLSQVKKSLIRPTRSGGDNLTVALTAGCQCRRFSLCRWPAGQVGNMAEPGAYSSIWGGSPTACTWSIFPMSHVDDAGCLDSRR